MKIFSTILLTQASAQNIDGMSLLMTALVIIAFIVCWAVNRISILRIRKNADSIKDMSVIMKHTLNLNGDSVLRLSVAEQRAYNIHGNFLPEKGMTFAESKDYIHPDDWAAYMEFCQKLKNGQKTAECNFRWNVSNDPQHPQWRYIHDLGIAEYANNLSRVPTNFFCTITDRTNEVMEKQQELQLTDKYRKIFELSLVGLAFYDNEGKLLTTNKKMREILNFQSEDDPYYYNNSIYEMPTFREVLNNRRIEDMWFCTKSVIVERGVNCHTEMRVHPIYDEEGMLVYITFSIRDITQERELYLQNKQNDENIRRQNEAIQQYENELQYLMENCDMRFWRASFVTREVTFFKGLASPETTLTLDTISNFFFDNDKAKEMFLHPEEYFTNPSAYLIHTRPFFHKTDTPQWNIIDTVPEFDKDGTFIGCYGIVRNVSDLIDKQEQLKKETERAKDSGHMKSVFMANMTHEIRTPLNSIVGFSDVLPMMQTPEEKQEIVKVIMNNCDMLLRLINDMLAISTLDNSGITIEPQETDFSSDFDKICQSLQERVQAPGVEFIADNPLPSLVITVDSGRIQQVLTNFVTNAIKYTHEGHIKVGYRLEERGERSEEREGLYMYCEDTGAGIPKEDQQKVFERFVKLNDYVQGTGLGLSICKAIAERCKGKIGVDSEGEGKGSTFWMWIPLVKAILILFTLHFSLFTTPSFAASAATQPDSIVVYSMEHPLIYEDAWDLWPYTFLNESGEPDGYNIDMLKLIFKRLDIPFVIKLKPTGEALNDLKNGKSDLMLGMDANFHDEYGHYGASVVGLFTHSVVHEKGVAPKVKSFKDLEHNRVIVHTGSFSHHMMEDNGWGANAEGYDDMKEAIRRVSLKPDIEIVWNTMSLKWLIQKYQITNLELSPVDIHHGEYKFMSLNRHLLDQIDSVYSVLRSEERLLPIQNKWFYPEHKETGIPSWIWQLAVVLAILAILTLIYYFFYRLREMRLTKDLRQQNARLSLILSVSDVRFWTFDIPTKTFTRMDKDGKPVRTYSLDEFRQLFQPEDFQKLYDGFNRLERQEVERLTIEKMHGNREDHAENGQSSKRHSSPLGNGRNATDGDAKDREYTVELGVFRRDRHGRPSVIIATRSDITEELRLKQQAEDTMIRYQTIFNSAMVDMVCYDKDGYLYDLNEKAARTFKSTREEIIRSHANLCNIIDISHEDLAHLGKVYLTQIYSHPDEDSRIFSKTVSHEKMYYEMQLTPVYDNDHNLLAIYGTGRDVTEVANTYNRQQENLRSLAKANNEVTSYIQNINYAMKVGGVRMMSYSSNTHMLTIYDEIGHVQYELTQTRTLGLTRDEYKHAVQRMFNSMDNNIASPISSTVQSTIHTHERYPLCLQVHFVPGTHESDKPTEYVGMCRDVSQLKYTENELEKETVRAQEVEVVKNAFLRNMSYEIRTPLNTVVGFAELFQMEHSSDDEKVFIEEIKDNSQHLLKLINNILFLSRLDARMIEIKPQPTDMAKAFETSCHASWIHLQVPGVEYLIENPYEQLVAEVDSQNVGIILEQIITNACQHTTKGVVRARIDYIGDNLIMAVEDTGEGIPAEYLPTIFERFATGANTGSGLGLSICHELVQQMGGTINIKSEAGKGTTVWVSIPCKTSGVVRK